jgi:NADPH-dependent glutamate synthase beta subunit-like oxidoreductase
MKSGHFISHTSDGSIKTSLKIVVKRLEDNPYLFGMADATEKIWQPSGMSNRFFRRKQKKVVWAIAEGRACAREVDEYLMGYTTL